MSKNGISMEYTYHNGVVSVIRVDVPEVIKNISKTVFRYLENYEEGYELCLPKPGDWFPTQVEIFFDEKDTYPELYKLYEFFQSLNETTYEVQSVMFLLDIPEEDIVKHPKWLLK